MGPRRSTVPANRLTAYLNGTDVSFLVNLSYLPLMSSSDLCVKILGESAPCLIAVDPFGLGPGLLDRCRPKK